MHLLLASFLFLMLFVANSKALVTSSGALVTRSFLFLRAFCLLASVSALVTSSGALVTCF